MESIAENIVADILKQYESISRCTIKVIKPDPPIPGHYRAVAVEITRTSMNNIAYIALGSNIGERYTYLTEAIQFLNKNPYIQVDDISSVYETEPVGYTDQSCF